MTSKEQKNSLTLLRNDCALGEGDMPIIAREDLPELSGVLSFHEIRQGDPKAKDESLLIHFFKDDYLFNKLYEKPDTKHSMDKIKQLAQYSAVCSPDFSLYPEMPLPVQEFQIFKNRWCGAHWQSLGLHVFPTVTWGDEKSYSFCFSGIEKNSTVVVSTVGCRTSPNEFLRGYNRMLEVVHPETIICYGTPFCDMEGNIISFPYATFRKEASA